MMWLLLNWWWLASVAAVILGVLLVVPATAKIAGIALDWVPRDAWPILAATVAISLASSWLVGYGEDKCQARWEAAQEAAQDEIDRREKAAFDAGAKAAQDAASARQDTRKETDEAVEVVKEVWRDRIVRLPAECRFEQPDRMRDEGRKAVAAARAAMPD